MLWRVGRPFKWKLMSSFINVDYIYGVIMVVLAFFPEWRHVLRFLPNFQKKLLLPTGWLCENLRSFWSSKLKLSLIDFPLNYRNSAFLVTSIIFKIGKVFMSNVGQKTPARIISLRWTHLMSGFSWRYIVSYLPYSTRRLHSGWRQIFYNVVVFKMQCFQRQMETASLASIRLL